MTLKYQIPNSPSSPRPQCRAARIRRHAFFCILHSEFCIHRAFSIVEVLFAVMILGIGFIMVAAIFPVGIQQGRDAIDDTTGRTVARAAANRAAAAFRCIGDADRATVGDANLIKLRNDTASGYLPIDPTVAYPFTLPTVTITNGANPPGTIGGGGVNLYQLTGSDWQYLGQTQYLSQLFFRTTFQNVARTGTLSILALALRDGRLPADQGTPLALPYVRQCQILTDGRTNIYSDIYIQGIGASAGMTDADITAFLGTNGAIVTVDGEITRMQDSAGSLKGSTPPSGKTWAADGVTAWMFSSDIPVIGSYTLTTSLP